VCVPQQLGPCLKYGGSWARYRTVEFPQCHSFLAGVVRFDAVEDGAAGILPCNIAAMPGARAPLAPTGGSTGRSGATTDDVGWVTLSSTADESGAAVVTVFERSGIPGACFAVEGAVAGAFDVVAPGTAARWLAVAPLPPPDGDGERWRREAAATGVVAAAAAAGAIDAAAVLVARDDGCCFRVVAGAASVAALGFVISFLGRSGAPTASASLDGAEEDADVAGAAVVVCATAAVGAFCRLLRV
jgi:hypothetical protein